MSTARDHTNIKRSFQARIGDTVETGGRTFQVFHDYAFADPELSAGGDLALGEGWTKLHDGAVAELPGWIEVTWLQELAGRKGYSIAQIDCFTRVQGETDALRDPFGLWVERLAEAVEKRFRGRTEEDLPAGWIEIADYSDPESPEATGERLCVQGRTGHIGEPEERHRHPVRAGLQRVTLTFAIRLVQDAQGPAAFYTA